jgi:hypothetical protein
MYCCSITCITNTGWRYKIYHLSSLTAWYDSEMITHLVAPHQSLAFQDFFLTIKVSYIINSSFYSFQLLQKNNHKYGSNNRCVNNSASNVWKLLTYCLMRYFIFPHLRPPQTIKLSTVELGQWVSNYQYGWILLQRIRYLKCIIVLIYH